MTDGDWRRALRDYLAAKVNDIVLIEKLIAEQRITPLSTVAVEIEALKAQLAAVVGAWRPPWPEYRRPFAVT